MKLLSIDVGMKNLALCLIDIKTDNEYEIEKWDVLNICEEDKKQCCIFNCKNQAKYIYNNTNYYCKTHAKTTPLAIPTPDINPNKIKKLKFKNLMEFANQHNILFEKPILKSQLMVKCLEQINDKYLQLIPVTKATDLDLIQLGRNMAIQFDTLLDGIVLDYVIIENQISPIATRMKTLQGMIAQYFINKNVKNIEFISSSNKLKDFTSEVVTSYNDRKKKSIQVTKQLLSEQTNLINNIDLFTNHKKKDDLADSFLQGLWFMKQKHLIKI